MRVSGVAAVCMAFAWAAPGGAPAQQAPAVTARDMYAGCAFYMQGSAAREAGLCRDAVLNVAKSEGPDSASPYKFCMPADVKAREDAQKAIARMYVAWFEAHQGRVHLGKPVPDEDGYAMLTAAALVSWPCP